jgi:hypothetical protein
MFAHPGSRLKGCLGVCPQTPSESSSRAVSSIFALLAYAKDLVWEEKVADYHQPEILSKNPRNGPYFVRRSGRFISGRWGSRQPQPELTGTDRNSHTPERRRHSYVYAPHPQAP